MVTDNTPIIIASQQIINREINSADDCRSAIDLATEVVTRALNSVSLPTEAVDTLIMTRMFLDSSEYFSHPFGSSNRPPLSVAQRAKLSPKRAIYGPEGGQSPQRLINEFAESIYNGDSKCVVICGAETTGAMKTAIRNDWILDWQEELSGEMEDRGFGSLITDIELIHHVTLPPQVYALFENAWRHEQGFSVSEHQQLMAKLFARFSEIAATNQYAQFPTVRSTDFLATPSIENYQFNVPYNKWMVAQDAVNQAAAVVLTSVAKARELGIAESQWVYLHGYGDADDIYVSQRPSLSSSRALQSACDQAFAMAEKNIDDIILLDLYSCFPIAVIAACDALGIDLNDDRDLTVTGGLPFFGGPGNNYSLHAIAEMHQQLTHKLGAFGLVTANGGFLSKQSVGIYSTNPKNNWTPNNVRPTQEAVDNLPELTVLFPYNGNVMIESYSVVYKKSVPAIGFALCREPNSNHRVLAKVADGDDKTLAMMLEQEPIGRSVTITADENGCYFTFTDN